MKRVDFQRLLDEERIEYVTRGKNVKRGELNIHCPFCGSADPSFHLGINLDTGYWACWRNQDHRGKSPLRLLVALLKIPYWRAREIAGLTKDYVDPDGFSEVANRLLRGRQVSPETPEVFEPLAFPPEFREITGGVSTRRHWDYLIEERGFHPRDVADLCYDYRLQAATSGRWAHRVILPYYLDGDLVTWTGRAIGRSEYRYLDLSVDDSILPPKETLYNYDCVTEGGKWLVVVEGPVDALKLDFYGRKYGVRAVGLSTNSITEEQVHLLADGYLNGGFKALGAMMDRGSALAAVDSMRMSQQLRFIDYAARMLDTPGGAKDAAAASPGDIRDFAQTIVEELRG